MLIDTAGLRRKSKIKESVEFYSAIRTLKTLERCDVAVQLLDAAEGLDKQDLHIVEERSARKRAVIAVNKWDLVEKDTTATPFYEGDREKLRKYDYIPILFISALKRQRIFKVVTWRRPSTPRPAPDRDQQAERRDPARNRALPPPVLSGKELKINYITQIRTGPPVFAFFWNDPTRSRTIPPVPREPAAGALRTRGCRSPSSSGKRTADPFGRPPRALSLPFNLYSFNGLSSLYGAGPRKGARARP